MKRVKYYYNTHKLRFEKAETPLRVKLLRSIGFVILCLVTSFAFMLIAFRFIEKPNEKYLRKQNEDLRANYAVLNERARQLEMQMEELETRDNNVYRSIFEAKPIPDSARVKDAENKQETKWVLSFTEGGLLDNLHKQLNQLGNRIQHQTQSYTAIEVMVKNKEKLLQAIPAIQPVSNKDLTRLASHFGMRFHPILKILRPHNGLDFTAPQGTPIYATADGVVSKAENSGGFGNHIIINHGYGFETLYAHMVSMKSHVGNRVKRGEVIGYLGSTGLSSGPHCHYEVHRNGIPVDPIYYFYQDLSPEQFDRVLKLAKQGGQSLD